MSTKGPVIDPGLCRCCGMMKKCRILNAEYESAGQKEVYSDMIMDCFGLLLSHLDTRPTERLVCAVCVRRLRDAHALRGQLVRQEHAFIQMKMLEANAVDDPSPSPSSALVKAEPISPVPSPPPVEILDVADDASSSSSDVPLRQLARPAPARQPHTPARVRGKMQLNKQSLPMSKVQQLMRERDPSYVTETNLVTIVEHSYAVPFKCRHNHLLCYYCGHACATSKLLREHTSEHNPKKFKVTEHKNMVKVDISTINCRLCPEPINSVEDFIDHITKVHNKKYYKNCRESLLPFKLSDDEVKCAICEQTFMYFHALNKHMNEHFSNYVCETCGLGFVDKGRFVMHQQRHEQADYPCPTCGKLFKAQYNRELHIDRVHKKRGRVYCPKCDVMLMSYQQKLKHLVQVHGEPPLRFPCGMCDRVFDARRMLTIHRRKDHLKDYRYECQYCGQKFFTRFALTNHTPTHTGERNHRCLVCGKAYPRLKTLRDHMRIHNNDRRYSCHICGQAFIQNCSLKGHMKSQHSEFG